MAAGRHILVRLLVVDHQRRRNLLAACVHTRRLVEAALERRSLDAVAWRSVVLVLVHERRSLDAEAWRSAVAVLDLRAIAVEE